MQGSSPATGHAFARHHLGPGVGLLATPWRPTLSDTSPIIETLNAALTGRYSVERRIGEGGMATVYLP